MSQRERDWLEWLKRARDGLVTQRLKSDQGEVREPVWGPFPH